MKKEKLKTAKPVYLDRKEIEKIAKEISQFYKKIFFQPLSEILKEESTKYNSVISGLIKAIKEERVVLRDGYLVGNIDASILKELKANGARYITGKGWLFVNIPVEIQNAINEKRKETLEKTNAIIFYLEKLLTTINEEVDNLPVSFVSTMNNYEKQLKNNHAKFTVKPTLNENRAKTLQEQYVLNLKKNIKNWIPENVKNLREDIEYYILEKGYGNKKISEIIKEKYAVSESKAVFLARQESSLLLSNYARIAYIEAGIKRYIWRTAKDSDVRESHADLEGRIFYFDNPPVTDPRTGAHNNPGDDYNCRCIPEPIIE